MNRRKFLSLFAAAVPGTLAAEQLSFLVRQPTSIIVPTREGVTGVALYSYMKEYWKDDYPIILSAKYYKRELVPDLNYKIKIRNKIIIIE